MYILIQKFLRAHLIQRAMCRGRLFMKVGWSKLKNNLWKELHFYQDASNKMTSYVNGATIMSEYAAKDGFVLDISKLLVPNEGKKNFNSSVVSCSFLQQRSIFKNIWKHSKILVLVLIKQFHHILFFWTLYWTYEVLGIIKASSFEGKELKLYVLKRL